MRSFFRFLLVLLVVAIVGAAGAWVWAGQLPGPAIEITKPEKFVGQSGALEMRVEAPGARVEAVLEQGGQSYPIVTVEPAPPPAAGQTAADRLFVSRPLGKSTIPQLKSGPARIVVRGTKPVLFGLRQAHSEATRDVQVRLEPPRVAVLSTFHYVNQGGSEFVVYRADPPDVQSGVRVGDKEYPGFPASGAGIKGDAALRVAFFALLYDQPDESPMQIFARDEAGNQAVASLDHMVFAKKFQSSRIEIDDRFLQRVVPAIAAASAGEQIPTDDPLAGFLEINGDLRRKNNQYLADLAKKSSPTLMFMDAFQQLGNSQVEAKFADTRTYVYKGKEVDKQVHLGFDLAVTANVPIVAAQRGVVLHAGDLGIYGNCVVIDHGMGVQSLYGHLSSIGVNPGDKVEKGQQLGKSGMTGLAGGDHLHFTMLVGGQQVTPVDWWSAQWMQDRVRRKIIAAGGV
ncbi:MAG TPA: M23 family metallopeptidase [Vicinamibacterales bacterium]|nr:M23 family metallopeptidase [Vicinamibacterales bacterium]